jgi:hypothetical protein
MAYIIFFQKVFDKRKNLLKARKYKGEEISIYKFLNIFTLDIIVKYIKNSTISVTRPA